MIGNARIGNWRIPKRLISDEAPHEFFGTMDDFIIFDRALSPKEVSDLYRSSRGE